jgi:hypothetical protein
MNGGMFGSIVPPVGSRSIHVQSKEQTLEGDVYRHTKLAKKELKAALKAEHKAQKVWGNECHQNSHTCLILHYRNTLV